MANEQDTNSSWKPKDFWYCVLGLILGFSIAFKMTNAVQRESVRTGMNAATRQTRDLPPDHPPVSSDAPDQLGAASGEMPPGHPPVGNGAPGGETAGRGAPPPLPSLEPHAGPGPKAEEQFKDIQVLKGVPAMEAQQIMGIMTVSLGVKCVYCHVPGAFDQPHPMKEKARKMMEMVKKMSKEMGTEVSCYTCHRGQPKPPTQ